MLRHILTTILLITFSSIYAQSPKSDYCSRYKTVNQWNRLTIDDRRSDSIDILHTDVTLDITNLLAQEIAGSCALTMAAKTSGVGSISLDFEGLEVDSVVGIGISAYQHLDSVLNVTFSSALSAGDTVKLEVHYHGNPMKDASGWGGFYFSGNFAWNLGVGFADDPHSYGRVWFPCFDNFIERSKMSFHITTTAGMLAACNGLLSHRDTAQNGQTTHHWNMEQSIPSYLACVAVGPYVTTNYEFSSMSGITPAEIQGRLADSSKIAGSFVHLEDAFDHMEFAYGPYRFDKVGYSLVPFNAGAMEHATNITYPFYAVNGGLGNEDLMVHELAHMWWGDNVTCQTDGDMWINEGWASFSEYLVRESLYGRQNYIDAMQADLKFMLQFGHHYEEGYRPVSGQPHEYVYGDHVYKKGALAAHNLRAYMGDSLFFDAIHQFMEQFKYSAVSSDSVEKYFSLYAGIDLEPFFRDWIFQGGWNVVVLDSFKHEQVGAGFEVTAYLQQKLKGRTAFHTNVPVYLTAWDEQGNSTTKKVEMNGRFDHSILTIPFEPSLVVLYDQREMAMAHTRDKVWLGGSGNLNLENMMWDIDFELPTGDSALVYFDHIWAAPDDIKAFDSMPYRPSNHHYWRVSGLGLESVTMSGEFFYDGRLGGNSGYMDMDLVAVQEDSLVLMYRSGPAADWQVYEHYEKNMLGTNDNAFGLIVLDSIIPGEYTLANRDHSALGVRPTMTAGEGLKVYPNPTNGTLAITWPGVEDMGSLKIMDVRGSIVHEATNYHREATLQLSGKLKPGVYFAVISMNGTAMEAKFVLE